MLSADVRRACNDFVIEALKRMRLTDEFWVLG